MKRSTRTENKRKDELFAAWDAFADWAEKEIVRLDPNDVEEFDKTYEGLAKVIKVTPKGIQLELESGGRIDFPEAGETISRLSLPNDQLYLCSACYQDKWYPIKLISIGSSITGNMDFHFSVNPNLMSQLHPDAWVQ